MNKIILILFIVIITIIKSEKVERIDDFNSIPKQPRSFSNKIFAIIETNEESSIAYEHKDKIDKIISKGFSLELDMEIFTPYIKGEWINKISSDGQYIHLAISHVIGGGETTFQLADAVIEIVNKLTTVR